MKMVGSNHEMIWTIKYACRAFRNQKWIIVNSGEVHDGDKTTAKGMIKLLLCFREINIFGENVTNLRFQRCHSETPRSKYLSCNVIVDLNNHMQHG